MIADISLVVSMLLVMGVIVVKLATTHLLAAARSELLKLGQVRDDAVERLKMVTERRVSAEDNRDFVERRREEQLLRREKLVCELAEISKTWHQAADPDPALGAEPQLPEQ